ncbi:MAG: hypothetical protein KDE58_25450, partial [Caldilineaceae bacterium]|nr:hypothetical protein [Caldilineaceae bacterium]
MIRKLRNYFQQERGASALYFALILFVMMGMASIAIDSSNAYLQRRLMQTAADTAALAGARALALNQGEGAINSEVQSLASANGATEVEWSYTGDGKGIEVTVNKDYDTYFARVLGYNNLSANSDTTAVYAPVVVMDRLIPLGINGCDCLDFSEFPVEIEQDDFGEIVTAIYKIGNANNGLLDYTFDLRGLDSAYSSGQIDSPYYMFYDPDYNGVHTVYGDGTAHSVERVININGDGFVVDLWFRDRTSAIPSGSPVCHGACPDTSEWYYYPVVEGILIGIPGTRYEGAVINVTQRNTAAQVGMNAHIDDPRPYLGAHASLLLEIVEQPTIGNILQSNSTEHVNSMIL